MDISKQIDKRGATSLSWFGDYLKQVLKEKNITIIELAEKGKFYNNINHGGLVSNWIKGKCMPTLEQFNKVCEILNLPFENLKEAEREVIGKKESACFNNKEKDRYTIGSSKSLEVDITKPSTELAKKWEGWRNNT